MKFVLYIQKIKEKSTEICPPPAPQIILHYVGLCAKRSAKGYNFKELLCPSILLYGLTSRRWRG